MKHMARYNTYWLLISEFSIYCLATIYTCDLILFCLSCILELEEIRERLLYLILAYSTKSLLPSYVL